MLLRRLADASGYGCNVILEAMSFENTPEMLRESLVGAALFVGNSLW
jgi:hypothetical protein